MKKPKQFIIMLSGILLISPIFCTNNHLAMQQRIDSYLQTCNRNGMFSGSVLIAKDSQVLFKKAYGMADYKNSIPNTPQTKFWLESVSKSITAVAILQLHERGILNINDPLVKYVKAIPESSKRNIEKITIKHLLTHRSGIAEDIANEMDKEGAEICPSIEDFVRRTTALPLTFEPGTKYEYSNAGYDTLSYVVSVASGKPFDRYLKEEIFEPIGMKNSGSAPVGKREKGFAKAYDFEFDTKKYKEIPPSNVPYHYGCGSIYSTVEDFLLWNRNLFEETSANKRIIKKSTIKRWFPVLDFIGDIDLSSNILQRSFNLVKKLFGTRSRVFRNFGADAFRAQNAYYINKKICIVFLGNVTSIELFKMSEDLIAMTLGYDRQPTIRSVINLPSEQLNKYVGRYEYEENGDKKIIKISMRENKLSAGIPFGGQFVDNIIFPMTQKRFFIGVFPGQVLSFDFDEKGNVSQLIGHEGSIFFEEDTTANRLAVTPNRK